MAIPVIPDIRELMEAGMHFGHASGKRHPKMQPYIFATRDKLNIIDLEQTRAKLTEVLTTLEEWVKDGKTVILVGTKDQVKDRVKEIGEKLHIPYVNVRWLGGTMTNFGEIQKSIARMKRMEESLENGEAAKMIKKERVMMENELRRLHHKLGGLRDMNKKPDALFIIDPGHEHNAVKEARHEGVTIFGVVDTNTNPEMADYVIPANDDGPKSLGLLLDWIEQTIESGLKAAGAKKAEAEAKEEIVVNIPQADIEAGEEVEEKIKRNDSEHEHQAKPAVKNEKGDAHFHATQD